MSFRKSNQQRRLIKVQMLSSGRLAAGVPARPPPGERATLVATKAINNHRPRAAPATAASQSAVADLSSLNRFARIN
jgi:hypothetical protein